MSRYRYIPHIIALLLLSSCSAPSQKELKEKPLPWGPSAVKEKDTSEQVTNNVQMPVNHYVAPVAHAVHASTSSKAHAGNAADRSPMIALENLVEGNQRYILGTGVHPNQSVARRAELTAGQHPEAIILSCSDSRVPPEVVFDKGLGEIFVIRTAGEVADNVAIASIEYAVEHLHSRLIVVMGHSSCGAVKAALTTPEKSSAGSPSLDSLVAIIRPAIKDFKLSPTDMTFVEPVKANVSSIAKGLSARSSIIAKAVDSGEVMIVEAIYHLDSGKVDFWF